MLRHEAVGILPVRLTLVELIYKGFWAGSGEHTIRRGAWDLTKAEKTVYFDSVASEQETWRKRSAYYHQQLEKYLQFLIPSGATVLEIGCGAGDLLAALHPREGLGIDISPKMVALAQQKHRALRFQVGDLEQLEIDEKFDYVVLAETIGYADDIQSAFSELHKVCKPNTRVVVIYYNYVWEPVLRCAEAIGLRMKRPLQHWLPLEDLENLLFLNNFEVIKKRYHLLFPVDIPGISTILNRFVANLPLFWRLCVNEIVIARPFGPRRSPQDATCSVIVPCRNERGNIEQAVSRTPEMGKHTELLFVEGHSEDGTLDECRRVKDKYAQKDITVLVQDGKGKGDAVRKGFAQAKGDVLMILDADLTVPPEELPKFFNALVSGKGEFINGSRLVYQMEDQAMRFLNLLGNKFFGRAFSYLLEQRIRDTLCGTKVIWREDYEKLAAGRDYFGEFDPFGDFDLLFGAAKLNLKIVEIPIRYRNRVYGETQISRFRHALLLFRMTGVALGKLKFI